MRMVFEEGERATLIQQLGLDENVDEQALSQAVAERLAQQQQQQQQANQAPPPDDESGDFVVVDIASFQRFRESERTAAAVIEANRVRDRDELIECAITDGKFGPGRRDHYRERYDSDPEGTTALIGRLQKNTVPLEERGRDAPTDEVDQTAYPTEWLPEVAAQQRQQQQPPQSKMSSRVHGDV